MARGAAAQALAAAGRPAAQAAARRRAAAKRTWCCRICRTVDFHGVNGRTLLMGGLVVCALGLLFGLVVFTQLKNLPVHASMLEVSELIYETCKTYLVTQGKFILHARGCSSASIIVLYFGVLQHFDADQGRRSSCSSA